MEESGEFKGKNYELLGFDHDEQSFVNRIIICLCVSIHSYATQNTGRPRLFNRTRLSCRPTEVLNDTRRRHLQH